MSYTDFLRGVKHYIEEAERQLDGAELTPEMRPQDVPVLYGETLRLLAIVERRK
jgi:hypothetical protein